MKISQEATHEQLFWEALEEIGFRVVHRDELPEDSDGSTVVYHMIPLVPDSRTGKTRRFELDFCIPALMIYVELDGFGSGSSSKHPGGHRSWTGFHNDRDKDRCMVLAGWRGMRFGSGDLKTREAVTECARDFKRLAEVVTG